MLPTLTITRAFTGRGEHLVNAQNQEPTPSYSLPWRTHLPKMECRQHESCQHLPYPGRHDKNTHLLVTSGLPEESWACRSKLRPALLLSGEPEPLGEKQEQNDLFAKRQLERAVALLVKCEGQACRQRDTPVPTHRGLAA